MADEVLQQSSSSLALASDEEINQAFAVFAEQTPMPDVWPWLDFDIRSREQAVFGSTLLHTTHDTRLKAVVKSLDASTAPHAESFPDDPVHFDPNQAIVDRDEVDKFLKSKITKNGQQLKRSEALSFIPVRNYLLASLRQSNHPIIQVLDQVDALNQARQQSNETSPGQAVAVLGNNDFERLVDNIIKVSFRDDIKRLYKIYAGHLKPPLEL